MVDCDIVRMYSSAQQGGELPYFVGKQWGSGWFNVISRLAIPIMKKLGLSAAKGVTSALAATATDALTGKKPFLSSLKSNAISSAQDTLPELTKVATDAINKGTLSMTAPHKGKRRRKTINKHRKVPKTIFD